MSTLKEAPGGRASSSPLMGGEVEPTIFEFSHSGRRTGTIRNSRVEQVDPKDFLPVEFLRSEKVDLPEVSERDLVAHFMRLTHRQYAVDLGSYPLGSCTMKYNPKLADAVASNANLSGVHPQTPPSGAQGWIELCVELERYLT